MKPSERLARRIGAPREEIKCLDTRLEALSRTYRRNYASVPNRIECVLNLCPTLRLTAPELMEACCASEHSVRKALTRMVKVGRIKRCGRGLYGTLRVR